MSIDVSSVEFNSGDYSRQFSHSSVCQACFVTWTRARLLALVSTLIALLAICAGLLLPLALAARSNSGNAPNNFPDQQLTRTACTNCIAPFAIEPMYCNQYHFGPLQNDGWNFRRMTVIAPFTLQITNLPVNADDSVLSVSKLQCVSYPPLGDTWWKQGKIGFGSLLSASSNGASVNYTYAILPGGGTGKYPGTGLVSITLYTPGHPTRPSQADFVYQLSSFQPRAQFQPVLSSVTDNTTASVNILTFAVFNASLLSVSNAELLSSTVMQPPTGSVLSFAVTLLTIRARTVLNKSTSVVNVRLTYPGAVPFSILIANTNLNGGSVPASASFTPLRTLRDSSGRLPGSAAQLRGPTGTTEGAGWFVTPVHFNYVPSLGKMLVTGWSRRDGLPCLGDYSGPGGRRRAGVSFLLDPSVVESAHSELHIDEMRVDEAALYPSEVFRSPPALQQSGTSVYSIDGDALYCSSHTPLRDGRIFQFGGGRYAELSSGFEREWGLDYARIFDPRTGNFTRVAAIAPLGRAWYPTSTLLPDGRVLVAGGFSDYGTDACVGTVCTNSQLNIFDPVTNSWSVLIDRTAADDVIAPGIKEYTRIFVLPRPIIAGGLVRHVLLMGKAGAVVLLNIDPLVPMRLRLFKPVGGARPLPASVTYQCNDRSDQSTFVPLAHTDNNWGEVVVIGGGCGDSQQRLDIYSIRNDTWRSLDLGIFRQIPSAALMPDGRILIANGENGNIDQSACVSRDCSNDPRYIQLFDPISMSVQFESIRSSVFRGYHNVLALLPDGSFMTGGGISQFGDVGCEEPNLHIFRPSYSSAGPRPSLLDSSIGSAANPIRLQIGQVNVRLLINSTVPLHPALGVAFLSVAAQTHSYDQNQRYSPVWNLQLGAGNVQQQQQIATFDLPTSSVLIPGVYHLFLVSTAGVPSVARHAIIEPL